MACRGVCLANCGIFCRLGVIRVVLVGGDNVSWDTGAHQNTRLAECLPVFESDTRRDADIRHWSAMVIAFALCGRPVRLSTTVDGNLAALKEALQVQACVWLL